MGNKTYYKAHICCCFCVVFSHVHPFVIPWTAAHQAPLSIGFPKEEYWSGLPFPSPGDLPNPRTELSHVGE